MLVIKCRWAIIGIQMLNVGKQTVESLLERPLSCSTVRSHSVAQLGRSWNDRYFVQSLLDCSCNISCPKWKVGVPHYPADQNCHNCSYHGTWLRAAWDREGGSKQVTLGLEQQAASASPKAFPFLDLGEAPSPKALLQIKEHNITSFPAPPFLLYSPSHLLFPLLSFSFLRPSPLFMPPPPLPTILISLHSSLSLSFLYIFL